MAEEADTGAQSEFCSSSERAFTSHIKHSVLGLVMLTFSNFIQSRYILLLNGILPHFLDMGDVCRQQLLCWTLELEPTYSSHHSFCRIIVPVCWTDVGAAHWGLICMLYLQEHHKLAAAFAFVDIRRSFLSSFWLAAFINIPVIKIKVSKVDLKALYAVMYLHLPFFSWRANVIQMKRKLLQHSFNISRSPHLVTTIAWRKPPELPGELPITGVIIEINSYSVETCTTVPLQAWFGCLRLLMNPSAVNTSSILWESQMIPSCQQKCNQVWHTVCLWVFVTYTSLIQDSASLALRNLDGQILKAPKQVQVCVKMDPTIILLLFLSAVYTQCWETVHFLSNQCAPFSLGEKGNRY